jgi:hypothetical protein
MESKQRKRLSILSFYLILVVALVGCAGTFGVSPDDQLYNRVAALEKQIAELQDEALMDAAGAVGAATRMYGRTNLIGGTKSLDNILYSNLVDGDLCMIIDENGEIWFYRFDASSTAPETIPYTIKPDDSGTNDGRWLMAYGIHFNTSPAGPGYLSLMEQSTYGYNVIRIQAPASMGSNEIFEVGRWRVDTTTLVDPIDGGTTDLETDDSLTVFILEEDGLSTDHHTAILPVATGSGVRIGFLLYTNDASFDIRIDPDGTDQIFLTTAGGDYIFAEVVDGRPLILWDCLTGYWCHDLEDIDNDFAGANTWREEGG